MRAAEKLDWKGLKINFQPHGIETASSKPIRTFVSVFITSLLMVGGKLTSLSCFFLLHMFCTTIYIVLILRYDVTVVFALCRI
jgi:hypothetical protein